MSAVYQVLTLTAKVIQYIIKHMQIGSLYLDWGKRAYKFSECLWHFNKNLIQWPQFISSSNSIWKQVLKLWNTENAELCLNIFPFLFFCFFFQVVLCDHLSHVCKLHF